MSSALEIIGNHKLKFNSGKEVINQFQSILNATIKDGTYQSNEVNYQHEDRNQIEYFVALDHLEKNFNTWKTVKVMTNYKYSSEINIYEKALSFNNRCGYKYWKENLLEKAHEEGLKDKYESCKTAWKEAHKFSKDIVKQVGGEMMIYFEDSRFQDEIDLCYQGKPLIQVFELMKKKWEPTELNEVRKKSNEFLVKNGWYFEKLTTK